MSDNTNPVFHVSEDDSEIELKHCLAIQAGSSPSERRFTQGAFHVVNREDLMREIELLLGVEAYSLRPWRGGATLFCFTRRKCRRDGVIYNYYK